MPEFIPLVSTHLAQVCDLSRALESDDSPCGYWGLEMKSARDLIDGSQHCSVVALMQGRVSAIGTLRQGGAFQNHLGEISLAVHPDNRREGIAKELIAHLERLAASRGIDVVKALILAPNWPSRSLFESLGYEHRATLFAEFKSDRFGVMDDCVYYKQAGCSG